MWLSTACAGNVPKKSGGGGSAPPDLTNIYASLLQQGCLAATPAYYQTAGDANFQMNSANKMIAVKLILGEDYKIPAVSVRVNAVVTAGNVNLAIYSHDAANDRPGAQLQALGSVASGASNGWVRKAVDAANQYQTYRNIPVWLVGYGSAGADYSLPYRRWNTATGSMFPNSMQKCMTSTDGGTTWTQLTQDSKPAMWNVIVGSQANHCPQLVFGRRKGKYCYLGSAVGLKEIPVEGVTLDCSALTADTLYHCYVGWSTTMTLEAVTTEPTMGEEGFKVKTGDAAKRYVGSIVPVAVMSGYSGPVDTLDRRLVIKPGMEEPIGKLNPYAAATQELNIAAGWAKWRNSADFDIKIAGTPGTMITATAAGPYVEAYGSCAFALNSGTAPSPYSSRGSSDAEHVIGHAKIQAPLTQAINTLSALRFGTSGGTTDWTYFWGDSGAQIQAIVHGYVRWPE